MKPAPDLRLGDWREVLRDVEQVDAVITDPPYGERTHKAQAYGEGMSSGGPGATKVTRRALPYSHLSPSDVVEFVDRLAPVCRGWFVAMTSHDLVDCYSSRLEHHGRYVFAPLPLVIRGMTVRLAGDGPSSWTCWIVVSRPRRAPYTKWGTLPGAYFDGVSDARFGGLPGCKPLATMRALTRDYSRPGDLICDPYAGGGTTLLAATLEGRRSVGAELDPKTHALAAARLRGVGPESDAQPNLFSPRPRI